MTEPVHIRPVFIAGQLISNMGACEGREAKFDNDQKEIMKERFSALDSDGNGWLSKHEMQDDELYDIITAMGGSIDSEKGGIVRQ